MFSFTKVLLATLSISTVLVAAQDCGPTGNYGVCEPGWCCSSYGWCGETEVHCDKDCLPDYSGEGSACKGSHVDPGPGPTTHKIKTITKTVTQKPTSTKTPPPAYTIPSIDTCGPPHRNDNGEMSNGGKCVGVGDNGYFYRCCSQHGHCGPKNLEQDAASYCGQGCNPLYGKCDVSKPKPKKPTKKPIWNQWEGGECGPIVNKHCAEGECCSGSNFCGTGEDYCGAANWCQWGYGVCW
ncbi:hypothetical protein BJ508DRAFT_327708 [Ascobolus immersus RN42]|uniref:Chitin-binding type-1 domain-containing protein n=1 Tax=Ascobolus immersus RN42 TaxID=1160509 RepID=A0A3N4I799_ASCIM|nr:hypothetical protein BJ508DRAFT_327708 [Ascobolus immersus RN42]